MEVENEQRRYLNKVDWRGWEGEECKGHFTGQCLMNETLFFYLIGKMNVDIHKWDWSVGIEEMWE